jgi:hypothetical protein
LLAVARRLSQDLASKPHMEYFAAFAKDPPARRDCPLLAILVVGAVNNPAGRLVNRRGHRTHEIAL